MYYVYVLKSVKSDFLYVGSTFNLKKRLEQHNTGETYSTKKYMPFKIAYYEAYLNKEDALDREKNLKQYGSAWGHLKRRIKRSLDFESD